MPLTLVTGPTQEPVTIEEAKHHMRIEVSADDAMVAAFVIAARQWVEHETKRALVTQTWNHSIDWGWPMYDGFERIELPLNPVQSVTSITYVDSNGASQTLAASQYTAVTRESNSFIVPSYDVEWPSVRSVPNAITVKFVAGYVDSTVSPTVNDVPFQLRTAVLMLAAHLYENRESVTPLNLREVPMGVEALVSPYRDARVT